ncbi:MAG: metallophosphoesterase [Rikenellaceae bacterium]|nr:metallophosphoesterase [Rikenellaceae bacterium]MCL2693136.1 metallophosphoesterase [Rikenellaceae bacterium]
MKRIVLAIFILAVLFGGCTQKQPKGQNESFTFIVVSDMGRRGESEQKNIADLMGRFARQNKINFLAVAGDPIHDDGVQSIDDEEWKLKIEDIYTAPSLHAVPWHVVSGNHEYNGSVQAILDYSAVSERWNAPARYYAMEYPVGKRQKALFVFIDTAPLIDKYRNDKKYSDAGEQNMEQQLSWLDSVLAISDVRWKIVIGHHPVYAKTTKQVSERTDMQERVGKILERRGADFYICGHIHNFQHINPPGSRVHYIVNSSASQSREVHEIDEVEGVLFTNSDPGYSVFSVSADSVRFYFVNHTGEEVYRNAIGKR